LEKKCQAPPYSIFPGHVAMAVNGDAPLAISVVLQTAMDERWQRLGKHIP
jgi:hypothetical protein